MALQPSLRPQVVIGQYDAIHTLDVFCTIKPFFPPPSPKNADPTSIKQ